jgi:hypothetical protein
LFFKRWSDVYQEEYEEVLQKYKSEKVAREKFVHKLANIPKGCLWDEENHTQRVPLLTMPFLNHECNKNQYRNCD